LKNGFQSFVAVTICPLWQGMTWRPWVCQSDVWKYCMVVLFCDAKKTFFLKKKKKGGGHLYFTYFLKLSNLFFIIYITLLRKGLEINVLRNNLENNHIKKKCQPLSTIELKWFIFQICFMAFLKGEQGRFRKQTYFFNLLKKTIETKNTHKMSVNVW